MKLSKPIPYILTIAFIICLIFYFYSSEARILTGKKQELRSVLIYDCFQKKSEYTDDAEITSKLYDEIKNSVHITTERFPSHTESWQADSDYIIFFVYSNKIDKTDIAKDLIRRQLKTKSIHGDPGYVLGKNERLIGFISELFEREQ